MVHLHLMMNLSFLQITTDFYIFLFAPMNLTTDQKLALTQRIVDNFNSFVQSELEYQIEDMKDNDELDWDYFLRSSDSEDITKMVVDMIAVPVS